MKATRTLSEDFPTGLADEEIDTKADTESQSLYPQDQVQDDVNHPMTRDLEVITKGDMSGQGVICYAEFEAGQVIARIEGEIIPDICQHSLHIQSEVYHFAGYLLNSCSPNVYLDMQDLKTYAIRRINPGDFLYIDYGQTEDVLFMCFWRHPESMNCQGWVVGRQQRPPHLHMLSTDNGCPSLKPASSTSSLSSVDDNMPEPPSHEFRVPRDLPQATEQASFWWERSSLAYDNITGHLQFAHRDVMTLAAMHGTPSFFYDGARVVQNVARVHNALCNAGFSNQTQFQILYAMKANRFAPILTMLKMQAGAVMMNLGIDACSPQEVEHAISCGFLPKEISFTGTSISKNDLQSLASIPDLMWNFDSLHAIRSYGDLINRRGYGAKSIGIRINPAVGVGRSGNDKFIYCGGASTTKFGIYREQLPLAMALAKEYGLKITRVHAHTGCGYLTHQLPSWERILVECGWFLDKLSETVDTFNVGGGLGVPYVEGDMPLDMQAWATVVARFCQNRPYIRRIQVEPGTYVAQDAGILLLTVNSVEAKQNKIFVGLNGGFNIAMNPAVYNLPFEPVPAVLRKTQSHNSHVNDHVVTLAGNINEALDVFYREKKMPCRVEEDDIMVFLNAGAYSSCMASNHCMRGHFKEFLLINPENQSM